MLCLLQMIRGRPSGEKYDAALELVLGSGYTPAQAFTKVFGMYHGYC
jgi:hypothetical protein